MSEQVGQFDARQELINLIIPVEDFLRVRAIVDNYEIKKIEPYQEAYPDDPVWVKLKENSNQAYKDLKLYEWKKRNENTSSGNPEQLPTPEG